MTDKPIVAQDRLPEAICVRDCPDEYVVLTIYPVGRAAIISAMRLMLAMGLEHEAMEVAARDVLASLGEEA